MAKKPNSWIWALPAGLAVAGLLAGCNQTGAARAAANGTASAVAPSASYFTVPEGQMGHVQVVPAARMSWPHLLHLTGSVDYNQFATTPVITPISGPVARVLVVPGQPVRQGQALLEISSPDFAQARNTYLKDRSALALAQQTLRRDQDLYAHHAIAEADVQQAATAHTQATADVEAAAQTLAILGVRDPATMPATALAVVRAPIAGQVVERDVAPGQLVQGGATQCFVISDLRTVWVLANVYQSDLGYVHVGDPVTITTDAYPEAFHGRVQFLSPALDPTTRTLQARIATRNPGGELKKAMYVTATIQAGAAPNAVAVPNAAILRDSQNSPFVYVPAGANNRFARRSVQIGSSRNGWTRIASGLQAGQPVVGDGSLFLQFATSFQN